MRKNLFIISLAILMISHQIQAQKMVSLKECYERAAATASIATEREDYSSIWQIRDRNLSKGWLPSIDANGSIIYNSSVIDLKSALGTIPVPGIADAIKSMPHDQYKVTLDINQVIFDGGAIRSARTLEKASLKLNEKQTETDLYKLRDQVTSYFFTIILLEHQKKLLETFLETLTKRIASMQSALSNGVILKSDIDVLFSEKIKLNQQIAETDIKRNAYISMLEGLTGIKIDSATRLIIPEIPSSLTPDLSRPELELYDLKKEQLTAGLEAIKSSRMPKAFGFATLGYGNPPGNNFFKDEFETYYILGAGIKWNIFDWNKSKDEKQIISIHQKIIEKRKQDLSDNLLRMLEAKDAEIKNLESLLESDLELIKIRKRITSSAESKFENGTLTATELLNEINSEQQAVLNHEIHKITLAMAKIQYLNISGNDF